MIFTEQAVLHTDSEQDRHSYVTYFTNFRPHVFLLICHVKNIFGATSKCKSGCCIIELYECFCRQRFKYFVMLLRGLGNEFSMLRRKVVRSSSGLIFQALLFFRRIWRKNIQQKCLAETSSKDSN